MNTTPFNLELKIQEAKVLIVDDTKTNIDVLCTLLETENYNLFVSTSGEEALNLIPKVKPDLLLLDIMMPHMNGYEVCEKLKTDPLYKDIPIIFLTAKSDKDDIVKGFNIGATDYVTKPFHFEEVHARMITSLESYFLQKHNKELLSELEEKYQLLNESKEKLVQAEKLSLLGQMVSSLSYEINNPCSNIIHNMIRSEKQLCELEDNFYKVLPNNKEGQKVKEFFSPVFYQLKDMIHLSKNGAQKISQSVKILRDFAHYEIEEFQTILLEDILSQIKKPLTKLLQNVDYAEEIESDIKFEGQPKKISQVFLNLISNAIYATKRKSEQKGRVRFKAFISDDHHLVIQISDNGAGIDSNDQKSLFEKKVNPQKIFQASKIGLSLSYEIVQKHFGNMSYKTSKKGTTFSIRLPISLSSKAVA